MHSTLVWQGHCCIMYSASAYVWRTSTHSLLPPVLAAALVKQAASHPTILACCKLPPDACHRCGSTLPYYNHQPQARWHILLPSAGMMVHQCHACICDQSRCLSVNTHPARAPLSVSRSVIRQEALVHRRGARACSVILLDGRQAGHLGPERLEHRVCLQEGGGHAWWQQGSRQLGVRQLGVRQLGVRQLGVRQLGVRGIGTSAGLVSGWVGG
jgi:hypothetical protein